VRASDDAALVHPQCVAFKNLQMLAERGVQLGKRRKAPAVAFDRDDGSAGVKQGTGEAAGAGTDLVYALAFERPGDRRHAGEQHAIKDEILPKRLARAKPVPGNHIAERF
jgi:hypothetical protein